MKDYKLELRNLHVHMPSVGHGTGTPKDRDEVNGRDVYEYDG